MEWQQRQPCRLLMTFGVCEIARRLQISPADVVEQLVVRKVAELGLLPRK